MVSDFPECEQFRLVPHQYANCRGERLTPEKCDRWRVSRGLLPRHSIIGTGNAPASENPSAIPGKRKIAVRAVAGIPAGKLVVHDTKYIPPPPPPPGIGDYFEQLSRALGFDYVDLGCGGCGSLKKYLNQLTPEECRNQNDQVLKNLRENAKAIPWISKLTAGYQAVRLAVGFGEGLHSEIRQILLDTAVSADPIAAMLRAAIAMTEQETLRQLPVLPANVSSPRNTSPHVPPSVVKIIPTPAKKVLSTMIWAYGVTTVPSRKDTLLPQTLASLAAAGFDKPRLFVDGCDELQNWRRSFNLEVTCRYPKVGVAGNWILSLSELVQREPNADRFAVFQDDCIAYRNLRQYLERIPYPDKSYLNLITELENESRSRGRSGWFEAVQLGLGAVALVFSREAAALLLSERGFIERAQDRKRGHQAIDGGILYAMQKQGWKEYCHAPSLVQHIGHKSSTIGHNIAQAKTFRGEEFDALELLK